MYFVKQGHLGAGKQKIIEKKFSSEDVEEEPESQNIALQHHAFNCWNLSSANLHKLGIVSDFK